MCVCPALYPLGQGDKKRRSVCCDVKVRRVHIATRVCVCIRVCGWVWVSVCACLHKNACV